MILSPIVRVLSAFRRYRVRALLIGGQAAILYGGAEFSRDVDFIVLVSSDNLRRLRSALRALDARRVFYPKLGIQPLLKGHACHFRCRGGVVDQLRVDVLGTLRGVASFEQLWQRRRQIAVPGAGELAVLSLPDLIIAKKTQRDKDWAMIRRLVEADMAAHAGTRSRRRLAFWMLECRTPALLAELARRRPSLARDLSCQRPLLAHARRGPFGMVEKLLRAEETAHREEDRRYWAPLREELQALRAARRR